MKGSNYPHVINRQPTPPMAETLPSKSPSRRRPIHPHASSVLREMSLRLLLPEPGRSRVRVRAGWRRRSRGLTLRIYADQFTGAVNILVTTTDRRTPGTVATHASPSTFAIRIGSAQSSNRRSLGSGPHGLGRRRWLADRRRACDRQSDGRCFRRRGPKRVCRRGGSDRRRCGWFGHASDRKRIRLICPDHWTERHRAAGRRPNVVGFRCHGIRAGLIDQSPSRSNAVLRNDELPRWLALYIVEEVIALRVDPVAGNHRAGVRPIELVEHKPSFRTGC